MLVVGMPYNHLLEGAREWQNQSWAKLTQRLFLAGQAKDCSFKPNDFTRIQSRDSP